MVDSTPPAAPWRRPAVLAAAAAVVTAAAAGGAALLVSGEEGGGPAAPAARALADATPFDGRSPREPAAAGTRVLVQLPRPPLAEAGVSDAAGQRSYVRSLRAESAALRSALRARGVRLTDVVTYERTWHGFAATVRTQDLADLDAFRARQWPVRRFYPATAEPARVPGTPAPQAAAPLGGVPVAVLDSGVDATHPLLRDRLDAGADVVDGDDDPAAAEDPRGNRRESSGTALAGVLAAAGERVLPIRIAGLQPAAGGTGVEDVARSDQLLAGLERAVDPDGDGATDDRVTVALVGVNAPYAGFADPPEASAIRAAAALGTLVVAPAGNEGGAAGAAGTVGSPGAAPDALTAGALAAADVARVDLRIGGDDADGAALLAGAPPPDGLRTAGPLREADPAKLVGARGRELRGRIAVVEAGDAPIARAAAAATAGARAVLIAEPRERRPLPAVPAGRIGIPVAGVTGEAAERALDADPGTVVEVGAAHAADAGTAGADTPPGLSPFSSRGPTAAGTAKPDLAATGAALTAVPGGGAAVVGGTGIAAAHAAVEAARLARARPDATPAQLRESLVAAAQATAASPARGAGAGVLRTPPADSYLTASAPPARRTDPCPGGRPCTRVLIANRSASDAEVALAVVGDAGTSATVAPANLVIPAGGRREAEISAAAGADGLASGRLEARSESQVVLTHPFALVTEAPAPPPLGPLELVRRDGRVTGVRFPVGAFRLGDPLTTGSTVALVARLDLSLVEPGGTRPIERLTPATGARELLPAEYAYTLPAAVARQIGDALRAFRAVARSPAGGEPAVVESEAFRR